MSNKHRTGVNVAHRTISVNCVFMSALLTSYSPGRNLYSVMISYLEEYGPIVLLKSMSSFTN